jgi:hypothetical protein
MLEVLEAIITVILLSAAIVLITFIVGQILCLILGFIIDLFE